MEAELRATYFESGKVAATACKNFILASCILVLFSLIDVAPELALPIIKVKLSFNQTISVGVILHAFFFYRLISAINYERLLGQCLREENKLTKEAVWRLSYPGYFNFIQHSTVFSSGMWFKVIVGVSITISFIATFIVPVFMAVRVISTEISYTESFILFGALSLYISSIFLAGKYQMSRPLETVNDKNKT
ncbi:hypothetical protein [Psychromonas ossibalaenae]|uniref:hypothetical protein n=1 Tax=Psychromonas ossibalaenae TaxID=444922 RepID=UPI0003810915|nr:hypothetical protein [Psychromonas ossibalaenae]